MENFRKLKMLYDIIRPIGLIQLMADALGMICMPYLIVVVSVNVIFYYSKIKV